MTETPAGPDPQTLVALIENAFKDIDFDALPDEPAVWFTTRTAEESPSKRFHTSKYCRKLLNVKTVHTQTRTFASVYSRTCGYCVGEIKPYDPRHTGRASARVRYTYSALLVAAKTPDERIERLERCERSLRMDMPDTPEHADAVHALRTAYNRVRALADEHTDDLSAYFALMLDTKPEYDNPNGRRIVKRWRPSTSQDHRLLGGQGGTGAWTWAAPTLTGPFVKLEAALKEGATLGSARAAAAEEVRLDGPLRFGALPTSIPLDPGQTTVTHDWLVAKWREQAELVVTATLDEWTTQAAKVAADYADLGELLITRRHHRRDIGAYTPRELDWVEATYRSVLNPETGQSEITVPAIVAAWLDRLMSEEYKAKAAFPAEIGPCGDNTARVLETMARLRTADDDLTFGDALAAARLIHTATEDTASDDVMSTHTAQVLAAA